MKRLQYHQLFLITILVLLFDFTAKAQFRIDFQYRPRFEVRDGYQKLAEKGAIPAVLVSHRARLSFRYEKESLKLVFTPQDVRVWGDEKLKSSTGVWGDTSALDLFEAYAELKLGTLGWLSVGRQQLKYDNHRLLADRNWNQSGLSYDAVILKLSPENFNLHIGTVWNTLEEAGSGNNYPTDRIKSLNFLWLNKKINEYWNISLLHMATGVTQTDSTSKLNFRQTTGFYSERKSDGFNLWADAYYQYGKNQQGIPVSAYLFGGSASYIMNHFVTSVGFSYQSGNSNTGSDQTRDNLFDVFYGSRHRFYGYIDYFRNIPNDTKQGGLIDFNASVTFKINDAVSLQEIGHILSLAQTNNDTHDKKGLGFENDLFLKYNFSDWGALESGYSFFLPTRTLKTIQNVQDNKFSQYFYFQLVITSNLFSGG
jgi:hypothetical protein